MTSPGVKTVLNLILEGSAKVLLLKLAEANLKEDILDYNWAPKPTKATMDANNKQLTNFYQNNYF